MKKNNKLAEVISANVTEQIKGIANAKSTTSSKKEDKTPKKKTSKAVKLPAAKKEATIQEVTKQQEASIAEKVVSTRDVKYLYPADIQDQLARKKWRQAVRNKYHALERECYKFQDQNSKEYKEALKVFEAFKAEVLKPGQAI
jgi:hypothetical protein|nr:MAG TPA: hypothetical protein [Caudoviricetes sp.]